MNSALQQTTALQAAVDRATAAASRATGYAAAMQDDAAGENMAGSDPHEVSRGIRCLTNVGGFGGEDGSSDVEEPAVEVDACKADRFVAYKANKDFKGEKRGGEEGGDGACAFAKRPRFPYLHHLTPSTTPPHPPSLPPNTHSQLSPRY